jgi:hypothetical protein
MDSTFNVEKGQRIFVFIMWLGHQSERTEKMISEVDVILCSGQKVFRNCLWPIWTVEDLCHSSQNSAAACLVQRLHDQSDHLSDRVMNMLRKAIALEARLQPINQLIRELQSDCTIKLNISLLNRSLNT